MSDSNGRKNRLRYLPMRRLFPNMITLGALCCGLMAIRFSLTDEWERAVVFIIAAAILDGLDGRIARMLNSTSTFGAQLDSLSDFICFGVTPALMMYLWKLSEIKGFGWALVLFYTVCCALRLARFNTGVIEEKKAEWQRAFFVGVPSPAGALLMITPLIISFEWADTIFSDAKICIAYGAIIALLMVSRIPTFAAKGVRIRQDMVLPFMLAFVLFIVAAINEPWITLSVFSAGYLLHIPFSLLAYQRMKAKAAFPQ